MADTNRTIEEKLLEVQTKLRVPKGQRNDFGRYNYRSCEDILEAVKPLLAEQRLVLLLSDGVEMVGDRYYVVATATLRNADDGKTFIYVEARAREEETKKGMDGSQITGAASSYARKYALSGLFDIDDTKDADTNEHRSQTGNAAPTTRKPAPTKPAEEAKSDEPCSTSQRSTIFGLLQKRGIKQDDMTAVLMGKYGIADPQHMTQAEAKGVIDTLIMQKK